MQYLNGIYHLINVSEFSISPMYILYLLSAGSLLWQGDDLYGRRFAFQLNV